MSYKPPRVKSGGGLTGIAEVKIHDTKPLVKVDFVDGDAEGKSFVIKKDKCPAYVQSGKWVTRLSAKGDEMYGISPINGRFRGKVLKFSAQQGKDPAPYTTTITSQDKKTYSFEVFSVVLEITKGKCKGMPISYRLNYNFAEAEGGIVGIGHLKSKYTRALERFLDVTGAWDRGEMKYADNVLPAFEKRILRAAKEFDIQMQDGWVDALYSLADVEEETLPKEEDEGNASKTESDDENAEEFIDPNELPWEEEKSD